MALRKKKKNGATGLLVGAAVLGGLVAAGAKLLSNSKTRSRVKKTVSSVTKKVNASVKKAEKTVVKKKAAVKKATKKKS